MISFRTALLSALVALLVASSLIGCTGTSAPVDERPAEAEKPLESPSGPPPVVQPEESRPSPPPAVPEPVRLYTYEVVNAYPHDDGAYTQGLVFENGFLYEGTGLYGKSSLRKVDLETGNVLLSRDLTADRFGEGITVYLDRIVQLTWQSKVALAWDKNSFELVRELPYPRDGWGITHDGSRLIASDGTSTLYFLDTETLAITGQVEVRDGDTPVYRLNELEFIDGRVFANVWITEKIAIIDPGSGRVTGWVDLSRLLASRPSGKPVDVMNGIAYDAVNKRLFVTGKLWPWLFEIKLVEQGSGPG
ncbi:MAG: glutaminyl-peptide cyclotransferase [Dehalococcoidia bacterium]|nr:glutaminyl-peptide cyclotransferase [Dehalococcoidia bacterium]